MIKFFAHHYSIYGFSIFLLFGLAIVVLLGTYLNSDKLKTILKRYLYVLGSLLVVGMVGLLCLQGGIAKQQNANYFHTLDVLAAEIGTDKGELAYLKKQPQSEPNMIHISILQERIQMNTKKMEYWEKQIYPKSSSNTTTKPSKSKHVNHQRSISFIPHAKGSDE